MIRIASSAVSLYSLDEKLAIRSPTARMSAWHAVATICACTVGAGVVSIPFSVLKLGIPLWLGVFFFSAALTVYSIHLLVLSLEYTGHDTLEETASFLYGPWLRRVVEFLTILYCYGIGVAYIVAIKDLLEPLVANGPQGFNSDAWTCLFWMAFMMPVGMVQNVASLGWSCFLGLFATVYLSAACFSAYFVLQVPKPATRAEPLSLNGVATALPIILFAFSPQVTIPSIYRELRKSTVSAMTSVATKATSLCAVLYCATAIPSYLTFGVLTQGNIFNNFSPIAIGHIFILAAFFTTAITIMVAMPVTIFPMKVMSNLLLVGESHVPSVSWQWNIFLSGFISLSMLLLALLAPGIQVVFQLIGSIVSTLLCYLMPAVLAWRTGVCVDSWFHKIAMPVLALSSVVVAVVGTSATAMSF